MGVLFQIVTQTEVACTDGCAPSDRRTNQSDVPMGVLLQIGTQTEVTHTDGCAPSDRHTNRILCHLVALRTESAVTTTSSSRKL